MNCKRCGSVLGPDDFICKNCGTTVEIPSTDSNEVVETVSSSEPVIDSTNDVIDNSVVDVQPVSPVVQVENTPVVESAPVVQSTPVVASEPTVLSAPVVSAPVVENVVQPTQEPIASPSIEPVSVETKTKKKSSGIIFIVIGLLLVLGGAAYILLPKILNSNNNKDPEPVATLSDYYVKFENYVIKNLNDYKYEYKNDILHVYNSDESTLVTIQIFGKNINDLEVDDLNDSLTNRGYEVKEVKSNTINNKKYITMETEISNTKIIASYVEVDSNNTAILMVSNATKYDSEMLNSIVDIVTKAEAEDPSKNILVTNELDVIESVLNEILNVNEAPVENSETPATETESQTDVKE